MPNLFASVNKEETKLSFLLVKEEHAVCKYALKLCGPSEPVDSGMFFLEVQLFLENSYWSSIIHLKKPRSIQVEKINKTAHAITFFLSILG